MASLDKKTPFQTVQKPGEGTNKENINTTKKKEIENAFLWIGLDWIGLRLWIILSREFSVVPFNHLLSTCKCRPHVQFNTTKQTPSPRWIVFAVNYVGKKRWKTFTDRPV